MDGDLWFYFLFFWISLSLVVGAWSHKRGGSFIAGFGFSILLSPLIAVLILAVREPNKSVVERRQLASGTMKKCPACAEVIRKEAVRCPKCGSEFGQTQVRGEQKKCPFCAELIQNEAIKCRFCGSDLGKLPDSRIQEAAGKPAPQSEDIAFSCLHCGQYLIVDLSAAGLEVQCPKCAQPLTVPKRSKVLRVTSHQVVFECAECRAEIGAAIEKIGQHIVWPRCGQTVAVPDSAKVAYEMNDRDSSLRSE